MTNTDAVALIFIVGLLALVLVLLAYFSIRGAGE